MKLSWKTSTFLWDSFELHLKYLGALVEPSSPQSSTKHMYTFSYLEQFLFTTSEMELDYYHQKVNVAVASRFVERLM